MGIIGQTRIAILKRTLLREEKQLKEREKKKAEKMKKANLIMKKAKKTKDLEIELKRRIAKAKIDGLTPSELKLLKQRKDFIETKKRKLKEEAKKVFANTSNFLITIGRGIDRSLKESEKQMKRKQSRQKQKKQKHPQSKKPKKQIQFGKNIVNINQELYKITKPKKKKSRR